MVLLLMPPSGQEAGKVVRLVNGEFAGSQSIPGKRGVFEIGYYEVYVSRDPRNNKNVFWATTNVFWAKTMYLHEILTVRGD